MTGDGASRRWPVKISAQVTITRMISVLLGGPTVRAMTGLYLSGVAMSRVVRPNKLFLFESVQPSGFGLHRDKSGHSAFPTRRQRGG